MEVALRLAREAAAEGEVPVGAVVLDAAGQVIGRGRNLREADRDPLAHAEVKAMTEAAHALGTWNLADCTLIVTLEPCPMCAGALVMSRVDRVVYGSTDARAGACESVFNIPGCPALNHRPEMTAGVLQEECAGIMKRFFKERRAKRKALRQQAAESPETAER